MISISTYRQIQNTEYRIQNTLLVSINGRKEKGGVDCASGGKCEGGTDFRIRRLGI